MQERRRWGRWRYVALFAVLALHFVVLTGLILAARTGIKISRPAAPIELLILPQNPAPTVPPAPNPSNHRKIITATPLPPAADALTVVTPSPTSQIPGPPIDWSQEAQNAAASIAKGATPIETPAPSSSSVFATPPAHHKGDQVPTSNGDTMIFVSDHCYQLASRISTTPTAINNGMGLQTYCIRDSKAPRGDLFDQLPAYKKLHPQN